MESLSLSRTCKRKARCRRQSVESGALALHIQCIYKDCESTPPDPHTHTLSPPPPLAPARPLLLPNPPFNLSPCPPPPPTHTAHPHTENSRSQERPPADGCTMQSQRVGLFGTSPRAPIRGPPYPRLTQSAKASAGTAARGPGEYCHAAHRGMGAAWQYRASTTTLALDPRPYIQTLEPRTLERGSATPGPTWLAARTRAACSSTCSRYYWQYRQRLLPMIAFSSSSSSFSLHAGP